MLNLKNAGFRVAASCLSDEATARRMEEETDIPVLRQDVAALEA